MKDKTYPKKFYCANCNEWFYKYFQFGEIAYQGNCPKCGVSENQLREENRYQAKLIYYGTSKGATTVKYLKDKKELADYLAFYLSETIDGLTDWDCEHLAINMLRELKIVEPKWWDKNIRKKLDS